jgi:hypothetical protein
MLPVDRESLSNHDNQDQREHCCPLCSIQCCYSRRTLIPFVFLCCRFEIHFQRWIICRLFNMIDDVRTRCQQVSTRSTTMITTTKRSSRPCACHRSRSHPSVKRFFHLWDVRRRHRFHHDRHLTAMTCVNNSRMNVSSIGSVDRRRFFLSITLVNVFVGFSLIVISARTCVCR